jgi:hypothetical protein
MDKITYRSVEPVTRQLIFYKIEGDKLDEFGLMKARHFDAIFEVIADDPIGETPLAVRADVERALRILEPGESGDRPPPAT